jgi:hypothetical protein
VKTTDTNVEIVLKSTVSARPFYGAVVNKKLTMSAAATDASRFTLVSVDALKSEVRSQHLAGKYALMWQGKKDAASPVSTWYVSANLDCLPYDATTWGNIKASKTIPLPLGVLADKVSCATVSVPPQLPCLAAKAAYLAANLDVSKAKAEPWAHFLNYGKKEGRVWPGAYCSGENPPAPAKINVAVPPAVCPTSGSEITVTVASTSLGAMNAKQKAGVSVGVILGAVVIAVLCYCAYQEYQKKNKSSAPQIKAPPQFTSGQRAEYLQYMR